jgi:hypothetical protein
MARKITQQTHHGYLVGIGASGALLACALLVFLSLIGTVSVSVWPASTGPGAPAVVELQSPSNGSQLSGADGLIASTEAVAPPSSGGPGQGGSGGPGGGGPPHVPAAPPGGGSTPPDQGVQAPQGGGQLDQPDEGLGSQQGRDEGGPGGQEQGKSSFGDCDAGLTGDGPEVPQAPVDDEHVGDGYWGHGGDDRDFNSWDD